jgi:hypothetical protein
MDRLPEYEARRASEGGMLVHLRLGGGSAS